MAEILFRDDDGSWVPLGEVVSVSYTLVGTRHTLDGARPARAEDMLRPNPRCPTCAGRLRYDYPRWWWSCELGHTLKIETVAARQRTRLGRLWLSIFTR